jgi:hypothetical protein
MFVVLYKYETIFGSKLEFQKQKQACLMSKNQSTLGGKMWGWLVVVVLWWCGGGRGGGRGGGGGGSN